MASWLLKGHRKKVNRDLPIFLALAVAALLPPQFAQQPAPANRVMGVVSAVTPERREVSLRTDSGEVWGASADEQAQVLRVEAGERDLSKAEKIGFTDINVGDRLMITGEVSPAARVVIARTLVVMSRASIAARQSGKTRSGRTGKSAAWQASSKAWTARSAKSCLLPAGPGNGPSPPAPR
jgi:hypothetical protein